ncbi:MAG: Type 1 glutamine amidotransferase-like domain-containing protein [candidate division KSB1 bacterium]|nr:Type 1 glutamine amidotransferase-like domain-containing protein [candidate division KSB1 bacterium]MDZ7368135.1 Type 1 glutamine amidotransferase-like domain-containing protein [candidate division KSB1 bacterium]MDZ7405813.1 Type 1 glutamine amidotransferase-like domain-containing protein [candidate division KSB1 bacterium]
MRCVKLTALFLGLLATLAFGQGAVLLVGGGSENYHSWSDEPYRWLVQHAANKRILILHYADASSFLPNYLLWLGATTATNLVISSRTLADDSATYRAILQADGLFLRGGDQWRYVELWKGTLTEQALRQVHQRGGAIGGTSAGAAVLSAVAFDARLTSVNPRSALRNPLNAGITFTEDFIGFVPGILADTHFYERGRIGRLLAMMAVYRQQTGKWITGVGIDDATALGVSADGSAEVFGSGVVTVLRPAPQTHFTVQPGQPLRLSDVQIIQMTKGFRIYLPTGQMLYTPSTATTFSPPAVAALAGAISLDGSNNSADWFAPSGSLARFLTTLASSSDTVGIFCSPDAATLAHNVSAQLTQRQQPQQLLWISETTKNDAALANQVRSCKGFVFVGNSLDSAATFFDAATLVGSTVGARVNAGAKMLFLGNDTKLAGMAGVGQTESSTTAAYRGRLTLHQGLNFLAGFVVMPRVYENADYDENRTAGLFWGLAKAPAAYGILLDAGTHLHFAHHSLQVFGTTPALIVDARGVQAVDFSTYRVSGSVGPRQSAALLNGMIHVVPNGGQFNFMTGTKVTEPTFTAGTPREFHLYQNYPNPFNPSTVIRFQLPANSPVTLKVFAVNGREVARLIDGEMKAGHHHVTFAPRDVAGGIYFYQLTAGKFSETRKAVLLK